jgi:nucleoid DNA-binding protein
MKKAALVDAVQSELQCRPAQAQAVVAEFFALIEQAVADEGRVALRNFGEFERRHRASRPARDLRRQVPVVLPEREAVRFRPAAALRRRVAARTPARGDSEQAAGAPATGEPAPLSPK